MTIYTALSGVLLASAASGLATETFRLTTLPPIPTTWAPATTCFAPSSVIENGDTIYNVGCGLRDRRSCCPPGYNDSEVIFEPAADAINSVVCPRGYVGGPSWDGADETIDLAAGGVETLVCCPSGVQLWSTFGTPAYPLCYTQVRTSGRAGVSTVSTYARPLFFAQQVQVTTSGSATASTSGTTEAPRSSTADAAETTGTNIEQTATSTPIGRRNGLAAGAIAGIVIGAVLVPALVGLGAFICWRRQREPPEIPGAGAGAGKPIAEADDTAFAKQAPTELGGGGELRLNGSQGYTYNGGKTPELDGTGYTYMGTAAPTAELDGRTVSRMEGRPLMGARYENEELVTGPAGGLIEQKVLRPM
ncbi:hypothetical protein DRE_00807 [Drechslerella stenobrocha 248]|uniref:Uncharacterized protein n=1 Tax=Drechslerella stenobrocha 248 TaxID=1043628 RepID=W7HZP4_9PEZI|nr:hypothetical protein DRE_00807 [Drechslerella stenobrocha 248]